MSEDTPEIHKLRIPRKKEARQLLASMEGLIVAARSPGGNTGEENDNTVCYWIAKLTDLSREEVDELEAWEMLAYQKQLNRVLEEVASRPSKKR